MMTPTHASIMLAPVDMRLGIDGLTRLVLCAQQGGIVDGQMVLFTNRAHNRLKALVWDGNGVWLCQRRLHKGRFHWPKAGDALWSLTQAQFDGLVMGLQWERIDCTLSNNWHM